jgi:hypothetical protein
MPSSLSPTLPSIITTISIDHGTLVFCPSVPPKRHGVCDVLMARITYPLLAWKEREMRVGKGKRRRRCGAHDGR